MAFSLYKVLKGLLIREENTLSPKEIEVIPGGTAGTKTSILSSQTTNKTLTLPDATDTLVGKATTDTLTNKTIDADGTGNVISNIDDGNIKTGAAIDATKIATGTVDNTEFGYLNGVTSSIQTQLDSKALASDLNNHETATSVHGVAGDVVGTSDIQTLTNKTIDADLNTITNIDNNDIKASAGIDASKLADGSVSNTELQYINSLTSNAQTQLDDKANRTLSNLTSPTAFNQNLVPDADITRDIGSAANRINTVRTQNISAGADTLTLSADYAVLNTNKSKLSQSLSSDPASPVSGDVYYNSTIKKYRYYDGVAWKDIGSGSGGSKNYLTDYLNNPGNGDFEKGTTAGWSLVNTTTTNAFPSGTITAGAASFTTFQVVSNSTTLDGTYSLTLAATSGVLGQGMISDQFMIDRADHAKVMKYSFDYMPGVTNDQSGLWGVAIYDVDNATWIQPTNLNPIKTFNNIPGKAEGSFQTSYNGTLYRIFIYCYQSGSAMNLSLDNIFVGPSETTVQNARVAARATQNTNQVVSTNTTIDYNALNFDLSGSFNLSTNEFIVPESGIYNVSSLNITDAAPWTAGEYLQIELHKNGTLFSILGAEVAETSVTKSIVCAGSTEINCNAGDVLKIVGNSNRGGGISLVPDGSYNNLSISLVSSNQEAFGLSYTPRIVTNLASNQTITTGGGPQKIQFNTISNSQSNVASWFDTGNYRFIPKQAGNYLINGSVFITGSNNRYGIYLYKNGTSISNGGSGGISGDMNADVTYSVYMNGSTDYLEIFVENFSSVNTTVIAADSDTYFQAVYVSNIQNSVSSEVNVSAIYNRTTTLGLITTTVAGVGFPNKEKDTHNAYNSSTGIFTVPVSGEYQIIAALDFESNATGNREIIAVRNGNYAANNSKNLDKRNAQSGSFTGTSGSAVIQCLAGDTLELQAYQDSGSTLNLASSTESRFNFIAIKRIGN